MSAYDLEALGLPKPPPPEEDWFAPDVPELSAERLRELYELSLLMRRFEEQTGRLYSTGKFAGFCHLYIGQEAVAAGSIAAGEPEDYWISGYREHAQAIAKGITPEAVMAELLGKATGCSRGKGGSMHMMSKEHNFLGGDGIVGGQVPVASGVGWAIKYRSEKRVCVCFLGDAAANQGVFYEALNMSAVWKLPVVYVIENNLYGMGTAISRTSATRTLAERSAAFAMPAERIDAQSFFRVYETMWRARKRAIEEGIPTLVEAMCYRYKGHSMSDPGKYRTREELESAQLRDPVKLLATALIARGILTDADVKDIDKRIKQRMVDVIQFAEDSPAPPWEWALQDVLVNTTSEAPHA
jgi:pyruvate dehydrogenase E1 component alpha subunit